jgi:hypothetical protein
MQPSGEVLPNASPVELPEVVGLSKEHRQNAFRAAGKL